ncbi:sporulation integral membrane protein YlbJ [Sulfobacillus thermosulfidooxidans DSM 9293]|uniref:Sporulation integral membrane protein YlbJ n=1 Tax=Sulfobacillus thermosulfidooxidans (strain DSM 9293 / VKM B-1269 / AT-1) TaxID=929705 RepID=A0A1W1WDN7_SULTA|nr:sporulation integral membrane protein YlbJ [Sulfobacillus thermosulfidooxidans]SMC04289.1 sporulation integral membrane protein YlbJ [Sulfobacillus thermosulfidooxidans DSM 9293]
MDQEPKRVATVITGFTMLLLTIALIVFSEHGYHATVDALKLFFEVVFPSLLPFFILSDVLLSTGMVHYLGVYFEPLMRPLFNVPGVGSFVFSMGLAAGYPMDAVLTAKFRRQELCTKVEGERLLAFSNSADPLFLFGAVAVGLFGQPDLGAVLALAHYTSVIMVGLTYRFYGRRHDKPISEEGIVLRGIHKRALDAMIRGRKEDGRPYGQVINEAISESMSTLFMIMSFMVLFAVLLRVLTQSGLMVILTTPFQALFHLLGLSPNLVPAAVQGFFEIDLGSAAAAHAQAPLLQQLILVSAIVAWSGLSVHGQVASVLADTDISMKPYFFARFLHAVYAGIMTMVFFKPVEATLGQFTLPAFADRDFLIMAPTAPTMIDAFHVTILVMMVTLSSLLLGVIMVSLLRFLRLKWLTMRFH